MLLLALESAWGIAVGLWILTGLAFLVGALLPGSSGEDLLGPALLTLSVVWTALLKPETGHRTSERTTPLLLLAGSVLALGIALTVVREGDQRSFLYVGFVAIVAIVLGNRSHGRRILNARERKT